MKNSKDFSIIIPCFNEGKRIEKVINAVLESRYTRDIIVVDDGSDADTKRVLQCIKNGIKIVTFKKNYGKTHALKAGIGMSKFENILLLDADLKNLSSFHIIFMIDVYRKNNLDILLAERDNELFIFKMLGPSVAWGGEKLVNKKVFIQNPKILKTNGYLFEPTFLETTLGKYKIGRCLLKGVGQTWKAEKDGMVGFINDLKMHFDYMRFLGFKGYIWQGFLAGRAVKLY